MFTSPDDSILIPLSPAIKSLPFNVVSPPDFISTPPSPPTVLPFDFEVVVSDWLCPTVNNPSTNSEVDDDVSWCV